MFFNQLIRYRKGFKKCLHVTKLIEIELRQSHHLKRKVEFADSSDTYQNCSFLTCQKNTHIDWLRNNNTMMLGFLTTYLR